jgi:hypothetical protein
MSLLFPPKKNKSQIAVIITFIIVLLILFSVIFINISHVSDIKMLTSIATDRGALAAASRLSTISSILFKQTKVSPDDPNMENCGPPIIMLVGAIVLVVLGVVALLVLTWGAALPVIIGMAAFCVGGLGGYKLYQMWAHMSANMGYVLEQDMSTYSSLREGALVDAASSVMHDTEKVRHQGNGNYIDDSTGQTFSMRDTEIWNQLVQEGKNNQPPPYIERFRAWYFDKRFRQVSEKSLATFLQTGFIPNLMNAMSIPSGSWDPAAWQYTKLSFPVTATISSTAGALSWLTPQPNRQVVVYGPVDLPRAGEDAKNPKDVDGFLRAKFVDLCSKIVDNYGADRLIYGPASEDREDNVGFIMKPHDWYNPIGSANTKGIDDVCQDLQYFTFSLMQLANLPISQRISGLGGWIGTWYDYKQHPGGVVMRPKCPPSINWDGLTAEQKDQSPYSDGKYTHDLYQRVCRSCQAVASWVNVLTYLDSVDTKRPNYQLDLATGIYVAVTPGVTTDGGLRGRIASAQLYDNHGPRKDAYNQPINSVCRQGRGAAAQNGVCNTWHTCTCACTGKDIPPCCCAGYTCSNPQQVLWQGIYGTCTGSGNDYTETPVCQQGNGDLYGVIPEWCTFCTHGNNTPAGCTLRRTYGPSSDCPGNAWPNRNGDCFTDCCCPQPCYTNPFTGRNMCSTDPHDPDVPCFRNKQNVVRSSPELDFQGQLAYNNQLGPTEVGQAIEILQSLQSKLQYFRDQIKQFADTAENIIAHNYATKCQLAYCWNDVVPGKIPLQNNHVYHFINVQIDGFPATISDYPTPVLSVKKGWSWLGSLGDRHCTSIKGQVRGNLTVSVSRYDTDLPVLWWTFRRRKTVAQNPADMRTRMESIRNDIMSDGIVNDPNAVAVVNDSAISSASKAFWGPRKNDVKLERIK